MDNPGGVAGGLGVGAGPGSGVTGGTNSAVAGSGTSVAGTSASTGGSSQSSGGGNSSGGSDPGTGAGAGGGASGGMTGSGGTSPQRPCDDVPPKAADGQPPNENCDNAAEYNWCGADWNKGQFCRKTCGDCSDGTGGSGGSGSGGSGGTPPVTGPQLPDISGGPEYHASRYWDCCKTHCATNAGAKSCGQDGVSQNGGQSSCDGGSAYACYSEAPRALGSHLSYGYVAKRSANCGACYQIQFTGQGFYNANDPGSKLVAGKQMIVKVSNTGPDVADQQFDLMIPGGGVGLRASGCRKQWGDNIDFGATYGGFFSGDPKSLKCNDGTHAQKKACVKALCNQLPTGAAREGCYWWVDWLELADNPKFRFKETQCPNDI